MNMVLLKKLLKTTGGLILLSLCFASNTALAQTTPPYSPPPGGAAVRPPAQPWPAPWLYKTPKDTSVGQPTIDKYNAAYLPYLPWVGQNVALLVDYANFFYQLEKNNTSSNSAAAYKSAETIAANNKLSQTQDTNMKVVNEKTTAQYQAQLTFFPNPAIQIGYALIPGTDTTTLKPGDANYPTDDAFNADRLLGITGYKEDASKDMEALIVFLGNLTQHFTNPGFKDTDTAKERAELLQRADIQSYILASRTLSSLQSMALSNFNYLAQEREIQKGLGDQIGMKTFSTDSNQPSKPISDASQLQVEKYLIDRRLNNPEWYTAMNTATPVALQRETLFVLMEMQRQFHDLRMINERMLATMSTMQMTMLQMSKAQLDGQLKVSDMSRANNSGTP